MSVYEYSKELERVAEFRANPDVAAVVPVAVEHADDCQHVKVGADGRRSWEPDRSRTELSAECSEKCRVGYRIELYRGRVLDDVERNGYDDSDFFAVVARADGTTFRVMYASTRYGCYGCGCEVDATPELRSLVAEVAAKKESAWRERCRIATAEVEARMPTKGRRVRVTSKRSKVPHGTTGEVFWFGEAGHFGGPVYRNGYIAAGLAQRAAAAAYDDVKGIAREFRDAPGKFRVGIKLADGSKVFCSASCVTVLNSEEVTA